MSSTDLDNNCEKIKKIMNLMSVIKADQLTEMLFEKTMTMIVLSE